MKATLAVILSCLALSVSAADRPRNIFDDDWTPPKPVTSSRPSTTKPEANKVDPVIPNDVKDPVVIVTVQPPARRAIPAKDQQAAVRKLLHDVYAKELADRSMPARRKLCETLLSEADKVASDAPVDQFVLLTAAVNAGLDASDLKLAFTAAEKLGRAFEVDGLAVKLEAALTVKPSGTPQSMSENVKAAMEFTGELEAVDAFPAAIRVCGALGPVAAAVSPELRDAVQKRNRELNAAKEAADKVAKQREQLKTNPDDAAANLAVGRYTCFVRGDWAAGLPMLAKGSDAALKALAEQELASPAAGEATLKLADGWWDVAAKEPAARTAVVAHAAEFYRASVESVTGLRKTQIEKRIAEAAKVGAPAAMRTAAKGGRTIDLLKMIDLREGVVAGKWQFRNGDLVSDSTKNGRVQSSYHPKGEYDFFIEFTLPNKSGNVMQLLSFGDSAFEWNAGGITRLDDVDGHSRNNTSKPASLDPQVRHTSLLKVRKDRITAFVDDKQVLDFPTNYKNLSRNAVWRMKDDKALGLGTWSGDVVFHAARVTEVP